jgi:hypothetical protein
LEKKNAYEWMCKRYEQVKEDRRINAMDLPVLFNVANDAYLKLKDLEFEIDDWKSKEYESKRQAGDKLIHEFQEASQTMLAYQPTLEKAKSRIASAKDGENRKVRVRFNKLVNTITVANCPEVIANLVAAHIDGCDDRMRARYSNSRGSSSSLALELRQSDDMFASPKGLLARGPDAPLTHWHKKLAELFVSLSSLVEQKFKRGVDVILDPEVKKQPTSVSLRLKDVTFPLNESEDSPTFVIERALDPHLVVQKAWAYTEKVEFIPYAGVPCFLLAFHGSLFVTFLNVGDIIDSGYTLDKAQAYLESKDDLYLETLVRMVLSPGTGAWSPIGYVPIVTGLEPEIVEHKTHSFCADVVFPIADTTPLSGTSSAVLGEVKARLTKAMSLNLGVFKTNGTHVTKWMTDWPTQPKDNDKPIKDKDDDSFE